MKKFNSIVFTIFSLFFVSIQAQDLHFNLPDETCAIDYKTVKDDHKYEWAFIVYIAADNDLHNFAARNIKQMAQIGSNKNIIILVHLDIRLSGNRKVTRRYIVQKGKIIHVNSNDPSSQKMDSGSAQTLISCCQWAIENYQAKHRALIFWNHGAGVLDPDGGRIINVANLFSFNPEINKFELDRSIGFLDLIKIVNEWRGVCWDDSTGHYLTNQKLEFALEKICKDYLKGNKFDIIGFDACLMSMIEVANLIKKYGKLLVSSQEVELGMGWDYSKVLRPFIKKSLTPETFAKHIVNVYKQTYNKITNDYTLSAIDLTSIQELEDNVEQVASLLISCLKQQKDRSVLNAIQRSRNKKWCTHFDEPSYIDLHHFYTNLLQNAKNMNLRNTEAAKYLKEALVSSLEEGTKLIDKLILASVSGKNLPKARGISIYFPSRRIHNSYRLTPFGKQNSWLNLLTQYLLLL